jgi:hypothetical protein
MAIAGAQVGGTSGRQGEPPTGICASAWQQQSELTVTVGHAVPVAKMQSVRNLQHPFSEKVSLFKSVPKDGAEVAGKRCLQA